MIKSIDTPRGRVVLREGTLADVEEYRTLRLFALQESPTAYRSDYESSLNQPTSHWEDRLKPEPNNLVILTEHGSQLVGMSGIGWRNSPKAKHSAILWGVYVHPEWRGLRIANEMVEACCEWAKAHDVTIVKLAVVTTNSAAIRCYERCGFAIYGTEPRNILYNGVYYDGYLMFRMLDGKQ